MRGVRTPKMLKAAISCRGARRRSKAQPNGVANASARSTHKKTLTTTKPALALKVKEQETGAIFAASVTGKIRARTFMRKVLHAAANTVVAWRWTVRGVAVGPLSEEESESSVLEPDCSRHSRRFSRHSGMFSTHSNVFRSPPASCGITCARAQAAPAYCDLGGE